MVSTLPPAIICQFVKLSDNKFVDIDNCLFLRNGDNQDKRQYLNVDINDVYTWLLPAIWR
jgi:hypothetical protein